MFFEKHYSLALGGGAARGLAHIGVLKYLEEKKFIITEVSGTSMGAIIGALYAIGKNSNEIEKIAKDLNYFKLIDIDFKEGLLKGHKVYKCLESIFGDKKIEDLDITLKIIATNFDNGEKIVFEKGKIIDAIRASISLPGIFKPHKIKENYYIDGGIVNNLPIEALNGKHVIAVSALKKVNEELKRKRKVFGIDFDVGFLNLNFQILQRSIILMMKQNEDRSIENCRNKDLTLIYPDYGELDFYSFNEVDNFIEVGYKKAKEVIG
ncbi:MAG: patatin-like phospholipase family protein [Candidatus Gracilibacteria bacterium]|nr:patatin-like phospholipase family protein [Candidatus Gracilibacteria bacterium]